jgi:hypothetical protein
VVIYSLSPDTGPLRQGEILSDLVEVRLDAECLRPDAEPQIQEIVHPYALVLTQDCDLDWDFRYRSAADPGEQARLANKMVPHILLCQAEEAEKLRGYRNINSEIWRRITRNLDERYHLLREVPKELDRLRRGIPALALDFKRVFTIPTEELYYRLGSGAERRCFLLSPFLQSLSSRFAYFVGRVAVPELGQPAGITPPALPVPVASSEERGNPADPGLVRPGPDDC